MKKLLLLSAMCLVFAGCGDGFKVATNPLPPVGSPPTPNDSWLVVDRAVVQVDRLSDGTVTAKLIQKKIIDLILPSAIAYNGGTPPNATLNAITYNNPASAVGFTLSQATTVGSYTGDILGFGTFAITGLDDNQLRKCTTAGNDATAGGNNKCTQAAIRVYSATGNLGGSTGVFCNSSDGYCVPLMVDGLAVGVTSANAAYPQTLTIANNTNRLRANNFTSAKANFPVSMDMSNAGAGTYTATLIVEYVLRIP